MRAKAIGASHGVLEVLNENYIPKSEEDRTLFEAKNIFIYSVLSSCLLTVKSKVYLRKYSAKLDAQAVIREMVSDMRSGTSGDVKMEQLEAELEKFKLDDNWNKSVETFLDQFNLKIMEIENIQNDSMSEKEKRRFLIRAIRGHPTMFEAVTNAQTTESVMSQMKGEPVKLSWEQFYDIVRSKAILADESKPKSKTPRRTNNSNQRRNGNNRGNNRNNPLWIPPEKWEKMSKEDKQKHWQKVRKKRDKDRQTDRNRNPQNNGGNGGRNRGTSPGPTPGTQRNINSSSTDPSTDKDTTSDSKDTQDSDSPPVQTMSANAAQKLLSKKHTRFSVNGMEYKITHHRLQYKVNYAQGPVKGSLIDSGANGGLGGSDVKVLSENENTADITGIDNNKIKDVPICTVAGLIHTSQGPKIGIFKKTIEMIS